MTKVRQILDQLVKLLPWRSTSSENEEQEKARKPIITLKEIAIFAALFIGIQMWQQRDMLASDGSLAAPHFTLPSLNGDPVTYEASSNKPTLFYFFAPWCSICHLSIENLGTLKEQIEDNEIDVFIHCSRLQRG